MTIIEKIQSLLDEQDSVKLAGEYCFWFNTWSANGCPTQTDPALHYFYHMDIVGRICLIRLESDNCDVLVEKFRTNTLKFRPWPESAESVFSTSLFSHNGYAPTDEWIDLFSLAGERKQVSEFEQLQLTS